jgi:hypothetical protein
MSQSNHPFGGGAGPGGGPRAIVPPKPKKYIVMRRDHDGIYNEEKYIAHQLAFSDSMVLLESPGRLVAAIPVSTIWQISQEVD